jgi:hypothetical protein
VGELSKLRTFGGGANLLYIHSSLQQNIEGVKEMFHLLLDE